MANKRFDKLAFYEWCRKECKANGVKLVRHPYNTIMDDGFPVGGYFDYGSKEVSIHFAGKNNWWPEILSHEVSHMHQWVNKTKKFTAAVNSNKINVVEWLNGKEYPATDVRKTMRTLMWMERECEEFSFEILKRFNYKNTREYIQKANSYTIFYLYIRDNRIWSKRDKGPYASKSVWGKFPDTFDIDVDDTYKELRHLYERCV